MILYNTTIKVEQTIHEEWLEWMQQTHIPAYIATGLFLEYKLCRILGDDDEHGITYALQFLCPDLAHYGHKGRLNPDVVQPQC